MVERKSFSVVPILVFTALYLGAALAVVLTVGNYEFLFYIVIVLALTVILLAIHRRVHFTRATLWGLTAWGVAHMAGGLLPIPQSWAATGTTNVLYNWWIIEGGLKYDHVVHAYGFGLCTWICWQGLVAATGVSRPGFGRLSLAALAAFGLGALNELIEFVATRIMAKTNVGGYVNTGWDLVANLAGVLVVAVWIALAWRARARS